MAYESLLALVALTALIALTEVAPRINVPRGLLAAVAILSTDLSLITGAAAAAVGVALGRVAIALSARRARGEVHVRSRVAQERQQQIRRHLQRSTAYGKATFYMAALPGVSRSFLFPLLGSMRAPLLPAAAGTIVGQFPLLIITTALFQWLGTFANNSDADSAISLAIVAAVLLLFNYFTSPPAQAIGAMDFEGSAYVERDSDDEDGDIIEGTAVEIDDPEHHISRESDQDTSSDDSVRDS